MAAEVEDYVPVYVPLIIYGREKYDFEAVNPGVFKTEKGAIHALIDGLIELEFISYAR